LTITLKNKKYTAEIKVAGAELISFKANDTGIEYIWGGDPEYWGRHTPVLFPHVGQVKDGKFSIDGVEYESGQHGFARDNDFSVVEQNDQFVLLSFSYNVETLKRYPYKFELLISYTLSDEGIDTEWLVQNIDDQDIYFGIGGHPAFNTPLEEGLSFEDYYFEVEPAAVRTRIPFVPPFLDVKNAYQEELNIVPITHETFNNDALVYETEGATSITLKSDKSEHSLTLSYDDIPYVGLWSPYPKESPFVCIEPWWSFADTPESTGNFKEKTSVQKLGVDEEFKTHYFISVK
jgi:galactose mutarotase-like enzyme